MTNEEKILQILGQIQTDVLSIKEVLTEHTEILNEHTEILSDQTTALNELIRWADDAQVVVGAREVKHLPPVAGQFSRFFHFSS